MTSKELTAEVVDIQPAVEPEPITYRTRGSAALKAITVMGGVDLDLILDHGFRIYSEQRVCLAGVLVPDNDKIPLVELFVTNWIAHAGKPSTLWITSLTGDEGFGFLVDVHRVALNEFGKPTGELESLADALIAQGIAIDPEGVVPDA